MAYDRQIKWQKENPKRVKAIRQRYRHKLRMECLEAYGGNCQCCGEDNVEFLGIDHIEGNGRQHRSEVGSGYAFYQWLRRNEFPDGFRVLCHNCNCSLGFYGYCPHQELSVIAKAQSVVRLKRVV